MKAGRTYENGYRASEEFPEYIDHWFYFSAQVDAECAAARLRDRGWSTSIKPSASDTDWLVLATQPATGDEEMEEIYYDLSSFAERLRGHYDGWERPMDGADFEN